MIEIVRYKSANRAEWDAFIDTSKVDTFLLKRNFIDYHADRFVDCSYLIFIKGKLQAVLPGNIDKNTYYSHQGLTYGGLICSQSLTTKAVCEIFTQLNETFRIERVNEVIYKPTPHIYHKYPSEEDIYALYRSGAEKIACNISSAIIQEVKPPFTQLRKRGVKKAIKNGINVVETSNYNAFWKILEENLSISFGKKPVHTLNEIQKLANYFPDNIKLFCAELNQTVVAGAVLFIMNSIVHVQYISANQIGKELGALDLLFDKLINELLNKYPIFDFGQSTDQNGKFLNEGLLFQKEGFGGRGIVYETYRYSI